jgi:ABC-type sugar transport system ATPase subunit
MTGPMLAAKNIGKSFGKTPVLRDVDLEVHRGAITVLIGPSGSGKSTLLNAVGLLEPPDSGMVIVDDNSYRFPSLKSLTPPWP